MALVPTNWRKSDSGKFPEVDSMTEGLESVVVECGYVVDPNTGKELILELVTTTNNTRGITIRREHEWWTYESINALPSAHRKTIEATLWLPGRNHRTALLTVQEEKTAYKLGTAYSNGPMAYKRLVEGVVIYTTALTAPALTSTTALAKARNQGRSTRDASDMAAKKLVPDSARSWETAVREGRPIESETAPQRTRWQTLSQEVRVVDEDWRAWIVTTASKNCLVPGDLSVKVDVVQKPNIRYSFPYAIPAPRLTAEARPAGSLEGQGAHLEVRGGDVELRLPAPFDDEVERVPVTRYKIFRRVVEELPSARSTDPFGIWETPPADDGHSLLSVTVRDRDGDPASPLPGSTSEPTAPDQAAASDEAQWELVADIDNQQTDPSRESYAVYFDPAVPEARTVEYYALALIGDTESPESNHETVVIAADQTSSSIDVTFHQGQRWRVVDLRRPGLRAGAYGDTQVYQWPVLVSE